MSDKQKQILASALKLFVAHGFHGTATAKIAEDAGVANGTLFHYYKTKDELVAGLYHQVKQDLTAAISAIIHDSEFITPKFRNKFINILQWALQNRDKFYYIQLFERSPYRSQIGISIEHQSLVPVSVIDEALKKKLLQTHPRNLVIILLNSQLLGIYQYLTTNEFTPEEQRNIINEGYEMVWEMLKYK